MVRRAPQDEFIVVLNDRYPAAVRDIFVEFRHILSPNNIRVFEIPSGCAYFNNDDRIAYAAELIREKFIHDLNPDFVHLTSLVEGLGDDVVTSIGKIETRVPTAVTIYDLIPYQH